MRVLVWIGSESTYVARRRLTSSIWMGEAWTARLSEMEKSNPASRGGSGPPIVGGTSTLNISHAAQIMGARNGCCCQGSEST